jgi:hypothetical protein
VKNSVLRASEREKYWKKSALFFRYRPAFSMRFVLREFDFESGNPSCFVMDIFLWQEVAHQRFSYCGSSHIFVHRLPVSCSQWQ